ncbi:hypothetical protein P8452_32325 [Trifolium repens]|nr:hypothetical protein P8452_32325 [Trifolium repens]
MYRYNKIVDRYGNQFEVIVEKRDGGLYFTHGWSEIRNNYVDSEGKGGWASITYVRPKLFVLILKDRYYRDCIVKHIYPPVCLNLCRTVFGPDANPGWAGTSPMPYYHDSENFIHNFIVILTETDVTSGFLTLNYGSFASKVLSKDAECVKLVDEKGLEWNCSVQYFSDTYNYVKIGGKWMEMLRARGYGGGTHLMFGSPMLGHCLELFVKKQF